MDVKFGWELFKTMVARLKEEALVLWFAREHADTPKVVKLMCLVVVAYILNPIDVIPDVVPVLGRIDDMVLVPWLIWMIYHRLPESVMEACRIKARALIDSGASFPISLTGLFTGSTAWLSVIYFVVQNYLPQYVPQFFGA